MIAYVINLIVFAFVRVITDELISIKLYIRIYYYKLCTFGAINRQHNKMRDGGDDPMLGADWSALGKCIFRWCN